MTTPKELAAMPGVRVKALIWNKGSLGQVDTADSLCGKWKAWDFNGRNGHFCAPWMGGGVFVGGDIEAAKAAAQADYEARIRSALEPTPAPETAGVSLDRWVRYEDAAAALAARDAEIVRHHVTIHHADQRIAAANKRADANLAAYEIAARNGRKAEARAEQAEARVTALVAAAEPFAAISDLVDAETEGLAETDEFQLMLHDHLMATWPLSAFRSLRAATSKQSGGGDE